MPNPRRPASGGGAGDDRIENAGRITALADALAATANVSVTSGSGVAVAADAVWDSGTRAAATAVGIAGDGGNLSEATRLAIGTDEMGLDKDEVVADGADTILNFGDMDVTAVATAASAGVAVTASSGVAVATATSRAEASASGIDAGAGTAVDDVYNAGVLNAVADAAAASASVSVVNTGLALAADSVWDGGTTATARARGIDVGAGGDAVRNDGEAHATATSLAGSAAVAVTSSGFAGASATSTGTADAVAIDASAGIDSDTVTNRGAVSATADAEARAVSVSFVNTGASVAANAVWEGGTGAEARSRGIAVGDGADEVLNTATVTATAAALAADAAIGIAVNGVAGAVATATAGADATAIDLGGDGAADTLDNSGELAVSSRAAAFSSAVAVTSAGAAVAADTFWDGGTTAASVARGIDAGGGADSIRNSAAIGVDSDGVTAAASVSVAISGVAGAISRSTATSEAFAIDAGTDAGDDVVDNSGDLTVTSDAFAAAVSVGFTSAGVSIATGGNWDGGTLADARARGVATGLGADEVVNSGTIDVAAASATGEVDVSVAITGVAAVISEQSTSRSEAVGIDAGAGAFADTVINTGRIDAGATSRGASASVGVTTAGVGATWNGGTLGRATARGIATGDGEDQVDNSAAVSATADAGTLAATVAVAVTGVAGAVSTADAVADATAIDTGGDGSVDVVVNSGSLIADSRAAAAAASVSVTAAGVAGAGGTPWDGGTHAGSQARGIATGGGDDRLFNAGEVTADAFATATGVAVAVAVEGVAGAITTSSAEALSVGIDAGAGDDYVESSNTITATSLSNANSLNAAGTKFGVSAAGNNAWDGGTRATSVSTGISTGTGLDTVITSGDMTINATAVAPSAAVSFNVAGVAAAVSTSSAEAQARAIDLGDDDDQLDNSGDLAVAADAVAVGLNVSITGAGVALSMNAFDGGTSGRASAAGIHGGTGDDLLINRGDIASAARVTAPSVTYSIGGIAAVAASTSTGETRASAIDGGEGDDRIDNSGNLDVVSDATAVTVNVAISGGVAGSLDSIWDGGTTATAVAAGLQGGAGDDRVTSSTGVRNDVLARAATGSIGVASGGGFGVSLTSSTANATAAGIDAGDGSDRVANASDIRSAAEATATSLSVALSAAGVAVAGNATWDGGTTANAAASGIALGSGDDEAANTGTVAAVADATALSAAVALAPTPAVGIAIADAVSTAHAVATAMAGDAGADILVNEGTLSAESGAVAEGLNLAFTTVGGAGSGLSTLLDHGTRSSALATGASGGSGVDGIRNASTGVVTVHSHAETGAAAVSLALAGVAAAGSNAMAYAEGAGLDGGAGDDTLINEGEMEAAAVARAVGRTLSFGSFAGLAEVNSTGHAVLFGTVGGDGDDWVANSGSIALDAQASAIGQSIGAASSGFALAAANADAIVEATGLGGGSGADTLLNAGSITVDAEARTVARGIAASSTGYSLASADTNSTALAVGIDGGDGDDAIRNDVGATVTVASRARTNSGGAAITIFGATEGSARTLPRSTAVGLAGGEGDDQIENAGDLEVSSKSDSFAAGVGASAVGFGAANTGIEAESVATGLDGGGGADLLVNSGRLRVGTAEGATGNARWMSLLDSIGFAAGAIGSASTESVAAARTASTGISGGDGGDRLSNQGELVVIASALSRSSDSTLNLFGAAGTSSQSGAITSATGLDGGEGDDYLESLALLDVSAESVLIKSGGSTNFTLAGANDSSSGLLARTAALGLAGGAGADTLVTAGTIAVTAQSSLAASGGSTTIAGTASASGSSGARTVAAGLDGGDGDDLILNDADLDIRATSSLSMDGTSYGFAGTSTSGASLTATIVADGILGGAGADRIRNAGAMEIAARSDLDSRGGTNTTFGGSAAATDSGARASARGVGGGDDDDVIENAAAGAIDVSAVADLRTSAVAYTFGGASDTAVAMTGAARAVGLHGDAGNNAVANLGQLRVTADASLVATGGAKTTVTATGGGTSGGHTRSDAVAAGLAAEAGDDLLVSTGSLSVHARAQAETSNSANTAASLISNSGAESSATSVATAHGIEGGEGANRLETGGSVRVRADSNAYSLAYANGASISLAGNARAVVASDASATAAGVVADAGDNEVLVDGLLDVTANAETAKTITVTAPIQTFDGTGDPATVEPIPTDIAETAAQDLPALADGGAYASGDYLFWTLTQPDAENPQSPAPRDDPNVGPDGAYFRAVRTATFDAEGNETGHSWQWVHAPVFVVDRTTVVADFPSSAAAVGHGLNGRGTAVATGVATASAWGVRLGGGDNRVEVGGNIFVTADADASLKSSAVGGTTGDAAVTTRASARAMAYGIEVGAGDNRVTNSGTIDVEALAAATAAVDADAGSGVCITFLFWTWCIAPGSTSVESTASRSAAAIGILAGDGDNTIVNEAGGEIIVRAVSTGTASLGAAGIATGSGDDVVVNNGLVSATLVRNGVVTAGIGIDTGAGNDQLTLGDGSEVVGTVALGDGDDTLILVGTPLVHDGAGGVYDLPGGDGIDTLILQGAGSTASVPLSFEQAIKRGEGSYRLPSLATLDSLVIDGGVLSLGEDYAFAPGGWFQTYIHSDGDRGQLAVDGDVLADGAIMVQRRGDTYVADGARFTVVNAAGGVDGGFASVTLPESRPLLSFGLEQTTSTVDVVASVPSFATVADTGLHREVALNLDRVAGGAGGDLARQLGTIQTMTSGFDQALASLAPDSYDVLTSNTLVVGHETAQLLRQHLANARDVRRGIQSPYAAYEPVRLAAVGGDLRVVGAGLQPVLPVQEAQMRPAGAPPPRRGPVAQTWTSAFFSTGEADFDGGFTEYDHDARGFVIGADYLLGGNTIAGFMVSYADSDVDSVQATASASVETWAGGLYATGYWGRTYAEGGITYSRQSFDNQRRLLIGAEERRAVSAHDGSALMVFAGLGREFDLGAWRAEPYATLYYFDIDEDGFEESGADSLNLVFGRKSVDVLLGEVGARLVRLQPLRDGVLDWHATLAYSHDFDLDDGSLDYAYQGQPGSLLRVSGRNVPAGSAVLGAGVSFVRKRTALSFDYRGQYNDRYRNHILGLRLSLAF